MISEEETLIWFAFQIGPPPTCPDYSALNKANKVRTSKKKNTKSG